MLSTYGYSDTFYVTMWTTDLKVETKLTTRLLQIIQYSFYRLDLLEFIVPWGKEAPYQK